MSTLNGLSVGLILIVAHVHVEGITTKSRDGGATGLHCGSMRGVPLGFRV